MPADELERAYRDMALKALVDSSYGAKPCHVRPVVLTGVGERLVLVATTHHRGRVVAGQVYRTVPRASATFVRPDPDWCSIADAYRSYGGAAGVPVIMRGVGEVVLIGPKITVVARTA